MFNIHEDAKKYEEYVIGLRQEFHRHPELSDQEVWTSGRICEELDKMGIPYTRVAGTNVVGLIDTGRPGKTIAFRGDIDALPVHEEANVPFKSEIDGLMHACGHDSHAAMVLGAARILNDHKDELSGKIYVCFQKGEEVGIGARDIVEYLKEQGGVDKAFGLHIAANLPTGFISLTEGPSMAGACNWQVVVKGKGGHGSMPYASIDPIKPLAEILLRITSLMVNRMDTLEPIVVSPCYFHAGTADNIIPETAEMRGTIRYFKEEALDRTLELVEQISRDIAASYDATATLTYSRGKTIPVDNDAASIAAAREVVENIDGLTAIQAPKLMGSDNFADFVHAFPGFYCFMGAGFDGPDGSLPNHHPRFTLDEKAFRLGVEFLTGCAVKFLGE
ncbi:MAG: amidohydrolase [Clostridiales bacterium]|nr:amidohydrolase [Clostridiales bacterium]